MLMTAAVKQKPKEGREGWLAPGVEDEPVFRGDPELSMKMKEYAIGRQITGDLDEYALEKEQKKELLDVGDLPIETASVKSAPRYSLYARETADFFRSAFEFLVLRITVHGWDKSTNKPIDKFIAIEGDQLKNDMKKTRILSPGDEEAVAKFFWEEVEEKSPRHRIVKAKLINRIFPTYYFRP